LTPLFVIPAKAGTQLAFFHRRDAEDAERQKITINLCGLCASAVKIYSMPAARPNWVPAFAGMTHEVSP
jgi:hypothetical protein